MNWLYRLQQRMAITTSERNVLLALALFLLLGLVARYVQRQTLAVPAGAYEEVDRSFQDAATVPADTVRQEHAARETSPDDVLAETPPPDRPAQETATASAMPPAPPGDRIDLNRATRAELQGLPRIGPKIAARILAHRAAHGPFRRVEDLVQVRGIGAKTLARLQPHLYVAEHGVDTE